MAYGEFGEWIEPGPGGSQPDASGYNEPEAVAARKADAAAGPGMARFSIPHADRGQDNKYEYVESLVKQGAKYADGSPLKGTDKMWGKDVYIPADKLQADKIVGLVDYNPKEDEGGWLGLGAAGNALFVGLLTAGAGAAFMGAGAAAGGGTAATTGGFADLIAFETAAATVPSSAPGILSGVAGTALKGAAKSAIVSGGVQLATTGKIDLKKVGISAAAGGFGSVLGEYVGGADGLNLGSTAGQIAGTVGGAAVGAALTPDSRVEGAISGAANSVPVPGDNPAGLSFSAPGIINARAPRTTDWKTPRLDWANKGEA